MPEPAIPDAPAEVALPPSLRLLKWLVIVLTLTMIGGVITIVALIVTRMPQAFVTAVPKVPENLALPEGQKAAAVTFGQGWIAVVSTSDRILIFDRDGALRQDIAITP
jgi:Flp pilus assembly protein protease CpaA